MRVVQKKQLQHGKGGMAKADKEICHEKGEL